MPLWSLFCIWIYRVFEDHEQNPYEFIGVWRWWSESLWNYKVFICFYIVDYGLLGTWFIRYNTVNTSNGSADFVWKLGTSSVPHISVYAYSWKSSYDRFQKKNTGILRKSVIFSKIRTNSGNLMFLLCK